MWKSEPYYLLYIPNPPALPHGIRQAAEQCFHTCPVRCLMICCLSLLIFCLFLFVFVVFFTICPVWVHTTCVFCMIGSYMGSRFACWSHYEILLDLFFFYCLLSSRLTIYKKADGSFYSVWIQSVKLCLAFTIYSSLQSELSRFKCYTVKGDYVSSRWF